MEDTSKYYKGSVLQLILVSFSAIIISLVSSYNTSSKILGSVIYFFVFGLFFLLLFFAAIGLLSVANSSVKSKYGNGFVYGSVIHGFMLLFPFAVLLLISDLILKWNAYQTIVAASVITSVSYSVTDLIRLGGSRVANTVLSLIIGIVFVIIFLLLSSIKLFD